MMPADYAKLAAEYARHLLYRDGRIEGSSASGCNLWALLQEGLGNHDNDPQVPLAEIVTCVREDMKRLVRVA